MNEVVEIVQPSIVVDVVEPVSTVIEVVQEGPQGPPGTVGDVTGLIAIAVDDYFVLHPQYWLYTQATPAATWSFVNPLGRIPVVTVYDVVGQEIEPDKYVTGNMVSLIFAVPTSGSATLR